MHTYANQPERAQRSHVRKKTTTGKKLLQALALAVVLVPLGTVAVEGGNIYITQQFSSTNTQNLFAFGAEYEVLFEFENIPDGNSFALTMFDEVLTPSEFEARLGNFPDYDCVPVDAGINCIHFRFFGAFNTGTQEYDPAPGPSSSTWLDSWTSEIRWLFDTNPLFPDGATGTVRVLQSLGGSDIFQIDITIPGSYDPGTGVDPAIGSRGNGFSGEAVVWTNTPEPASLILLGSGLTGLVYRHRRRLKRKASPPPVG